MTSFMRKFNIFVIVLLCALSLLPTSTIPAYAAGDEAYEYTDVMEDLSVDSTFDIEDYPAYEDEKFSIDIIAISESVNDELFVYTYQPSALVYPVTASSVDISVTIYDDIAFHNYKLKPLSQSGLFGKYQVEGLTVTRGEKRYYAISDILRPWNKGLGDKTGPYGNTISEVSFEVGKQWEFDEKDNVRVVDIETIVVTDKFCGFVRYLDGFKLFNNGACDSHFVAFNTDKPIDKLLEADVYYTYQNWERDGSGYMGTSGAYLQVYDDPTFENVHEKEVTVKSEEAVEYKGDGLWAKKFTWERIESITDFIAGVEFDEQVYNGSFIDVSLGSKLTDSAKEALKSKSWVLRFLETPFEHSETPLVLGGGYLYHEAGTIVGAVKILRLKFVTDGKTYNLGVVDNKQSGDPFDSVNDTGYKEDDPFGRFLEMLKEFLRKAWSVIKPILIALASVAVAILVVWLISKLVEIFKRPKVVIKDDKKKKHKE